MNEIQTAYLVPRGCEEFLVNELKDVIAVYERLILAKGTPQRALWAQNIWFNPTTLEIKSIGDAAKILRGVQRNWCAYSFAHHRRIKLIQEQLPHISHKPIEFLAKIPEAPLGSWTLVDANTLLFSSHCSSAVPHGEWNFNEDKINPPSRAYLKLWELFSRFNFHPTKDDLCLDLGASPGGWTWVLAKLAGKVISFDRSELADNVMALKNVQFIKNDAFKVKLADYPEASWIFSDVICYPEKLYDFITNLLNEYPDKKYVFTIKFQGTKHEEIIEKFMTLPGTIVHLSQNKHELTWFKI